MRAHEVNIAVPSGVFPPQSRRYTRGSVKPEVKRMTIPEWVRQLRARLGITSQGALAGQLGLGDRSTVAKWEGGTATPRLTSWRKMWTMAPPDLRACAPDVIAGLGVTDREVNIQDEMAKGYVANTKEAATVAEEIDSIEEPLLRRRARNAALRCIEEILRGPPPQDREPQRPKT